MNENISLVTQALDAATQKGVFGSLYSAAAVHDAWIKIQAELLASKKTETKTELLNPS